MKKYNFSSQHWMVIFVSVLLFMLTNACTSDGENVILPKLAQVNGWDYPMMLTLATIAGCASVIGNLILGRICAKKGSKFVIVAGLFLSAVFVFMYGAAQHLWMYAIGLFGAICSAQAISFIGANALIANWFPRKKGLAMGFVSIGPPLATIIMASVLNGIINHVGLRGGVLVISIVLVLMGIFCLIFLHETPEYCGATPDNMSREELEQLVKEEEQEEKMPLSALLRMKAFWYIVVIIGILSLCQTGLMAQFLVRYTDSGFPESSAVVMLSVCAVVGIFGSMLVGYVENRLGTKRAYAIFAMVFAVAFFINFTNIRILMYISIPLFGIVITLLQIFLSSFEISIFGRKNFRQANAIIFPIISMAGQLTFLLISVCMRIFGEIRYAYLVFGILLLVTQIFNYLMPLKKTNS